MAPTRKEPTVVFEDPHILVLDKPFGMSVHGDGVRDEYTLADWIKEKYPALEKVGDAIVHSNGTKIIRPGIVHRIDKETSGIILVAKDRETYLFLKRQFKDRKVFKVYHAVVYGEVNSKDGMIRLPIGRDAKDFRRKTINPRNSDGGMREAITYFNVLAKKEGFSYLDVRPATGRTHQIRVHLLSRKHPIVADRLYSNRKESNPWFKRLALHARSITVRLPQGIERTFTADFPEDFEKARISFGL